jgi:ABC-type multidrug transport system fused ATPase/permease subunit
MDTDKAVHKCIQEEFQEATIFTIAHRISTIADYDKIIVM